MVANEGFAPRQGPSQRPCLRWSKRLAASSGVPGYSRTESGVRDGRVGLRHATSSSSANDLRAWFVRPSHDCGAQTTDYPAGAPGQRLSPGIVRALAKLEEEIVSQPMRPVSEQALDVASWNREVAARHGRTWLEVGWYFAETYLYRRALEAVGYFQPGPWNRCDPFGKQKQQQAAMAVEQLAAVWCQLAVAEPNVAFEALVHSCLWGNRADLSNILIKVRARGGLVAREERHNILIDHKGGSSGSAGRRPGTDRLRERQRRPGTAV